MSELATPTLVLKPLKCCDFVIFWQIWSSRPVTDTKPGGGQVSTQPSLDHISCPGMHFRASWRRKKCPKWWGTLPLRTPVNRDTPFKLSHAICFSGEGTAKDFKRKIHILHTNLKWMSIMTPFGVTRVKQVFDHGATIQITEDTWSCTSNTMMNQLAFLGAQNYSDAYGTRLTLTASQSWMSGSPFPSCPILHSHWQVV